MQRPNRQPLSRRRAITATLAAIAALAAVSAAAWWVKERRPAQDLRVSFRIPVAAPSHPAITYMFQNLGRRPAAVRGVGLLTIAGNPPVIGPSDNIDLCDKVDPADLTPPDALTARGTEVAGAGQKREEYAPDSLSAGGKPRSPSAVFEIAGGQSLAVAATFKTDPQQTQGTTNQVFCPIVWLAQAGQGSTSVCQGFATATSKNGVSNTIVARQFRLLPARLDVSCPLAGH